MSQRIDGPTRTFPVSAALGANVRVKISSGKLAAADADDANWIGVTERPTFAADELVAVALRTKQGTVQIKANGAITAGALAYAAADGEVAPSGTVVCGVAMEAAGADGDIIEVMLTDA